MRRRPRRILAGVLIVLGGLLLLLAPETWPGLVLLIFAIAIEIVGIYLEHKASK